jgi:hypothetical protein
MKVHKFCHNPSIAEFAHFRNLCYDSKNRKQVIFHFGKEHSNGNTGIC